MWAESNGHYMQIKLPCGIVWLSGNMISNTKESGRGDSSRRSEFDAFSPAWGKVWRFGSIRSSLGRWRKERTSAVARVDVQGLHLSMVLVLLRADKSHVHPSLRRWCTALDGGFYNNYSIWRKNALYWNGLEDISSYRCIGSSVANL